MFTFHIKKYWLIVSILLSVICFNAYADVSLPTPKNLTQPLDNIVAYVNDGIITQQELHAGIIRMKKILAKNGQAVPSDDRLSNVVLQQLIFQKIQMQMVKRAGIKISDEQIDKTIARIAKRNHTTARKIEKQAAKQGIHNFRKEIAKEMSMTMIQQQAVGKTVVVSDHDVDQFYKKYKQQAEDQVKYHLIDVLVPLAQSPSENQVQMAKKTALSIAKKMKAGGNIDSIVSHYTNVISNDLGWNSMSALPNIFVAQLSTMKKGKVAGPLRAPNGFHIIKFLGKQGKMGALPSRENIQNLLYQKKFQKAVQKWLMHLKETSYIKINLPEE